MNDKSKVRMREQIESVIEKIEAAFPDLLIFQDEISANELKAFQDGEDYFCIVFTTGDFNSGDSKKFLTQDFMLDYYSENRDDVDEMIIDLITLMDQVKTFEFETTAKQRFKVKDTERYVDVTAIEFKRKVQYECSV
ncbi:hypothetical protein [Jeotgalibacillus haloalkalitolerans]|uniref:Uncharacterized protein n=1 Tax=Jeotgalibacillus haloalkalitolerans TaxID=3104292 RepID=A0ABU5KMS2_9BACL|nr:hypothetical protein [Jeotgalibacillus sp. HH7-29]MDZ5712241.1 hypothetical protein [Jeotgalibacillus sp. HH7-29]